MENNYIKHCGLKGSVQVYLSTTGLNRTISIASKFPLVGNRPLKQEKTPRNSI